MIKSRNKDFIEKMKDNALTNINLDILYSDLIE